MVAISFVDMESGTRWFYYLVLSWFINATLLSLISIKPASISLSKPERIQINLKTLAATRIEPTSTVEPVKQNLSESPAPIQKKITIEKKAKQKILPPLIKKIKKAKLKPLIVEKEKVLEKQTITKKIIPVQQHVKAPVKESKKVKKEYIPTQLIKSFEEKKIEKNTSIVIQEAKYRKQYPPVYPGRALELGQEGNVILHALVKPDGLTEELKVADSSGFSILDKAALAAVRKWEFEPINQNGIAIKSWVKVPIEFVIQ